MTALPPPASPVLAPPPPIVYNALPPNANRPNLDKPASFESQWLEHLLPYLTVGFQPISTANKDNQIRQACNALAHSFNHARTLYQRTVANAPVLANITGQSILDDFHNVPTWTAAVDAYLGARPADAVAPDAAALAALAAERNTLLAVGTVFPPRRINGLQLWIMLEYIINPAEGTTYQLAFINEGFYGKLALTQMNPDVYVYDDNMEEPTNIFPVSAGFLDPMRPVLFIWSDNYDEKFKDVPEVANRIARARAPKVPPRTQWLGMGLPGLREAVSRRQTVYNWGLGNALEAYNAYDTFIVSTNSILAPGPQVLLDAEPGVFVRWCLSKWGALIPGFAWCATPGEVTDGYVVDGNSAKLTPHRLVPTPVTDDAVKARWPVWGSWVPHFLQWPTVIPRASAAAQPGGLITEYEDDDRPMRLAPPYDGGDDHDMQLHWYRAIQFYDKTGGLDLMPNEDDDVFLPQGQTQAAQFRYGDWFLDNTGMRSGVPDPIRTAMVRDSGRVEGMVRTRKLQRVYNPWGIPSNLPLMRTKVDNLNWLTALDVQREGTMRNIDTSGMSRSDLIPVIRNFTQTMMRRLPLYTVNTAQAKGKYGSTTKYEVGEVVMLSGPNRDGGETGRLADDGTELQVVNDYEGYEGQLPENSLDQLGGSVFDLYMLNTDFAQIMWVPLERQLRIDVAGNVVDYDVEAGVRG